MVQWKNRWWEKESLWEKESTYQTLLLVFYSSCGGISDDDPVVVVTDLCFESSNHSCLSMSSPITVLSWKPWTSTIKIERYQFGSKNANTRRYQKCIPKHSRTYTELPNKSASSSPSLKHIYLELQVYFSTHIGPPFPQRLPCSQVLLQQGWWMKHRLP